MEVNDFEKKIESHMDGFKLTPSAEVWESLERKLRKENRRRILIFFLLAGLLVGVGTVAVKSDFFGKNPGQNNLAKEFIPQSVKQPSVNDNASNNRTNSMPSSHPQKVVNDFISKERKSKKKTLGIINIDSNTYSVNHKKRLAKILTNREHDKKNVAATPVLEDTNTNTKEVHVARKEKKEVFIMTNGVTENKANPATIEVDKENRKHIEEKKSGLNEEETLVSDVIPDKNESLLLSIKTQNEDSAKPIVPLATRSKKMRNGFSFFVTVAGGHAGLKDRVLSLVGSENSLADAAANYNTNTSIGNTLIRYYPQRIGNGIYWTVGGGVDKHLSKKIDINAGVQYTYVNYINKIGYLVNNNTINVAQSYGSYYTTRYYYTGPMTYDYHNTFHYLQLPVLISWQLNKVTSKLPLRWNIGLAPGYLAHTNALIYDTTGQGVYYYNRSKFKNLSLSIETGLTIGASIGKGYEIRVGPQVSIQATSIYKKGTTSQHFGLTGLRAVLSRKKK